MTTSNHSRTVVNGMLSQIHKEAKPRVNVSDVQRLFNDGYARVIASVTHTTASRENHELVLESLSAAIGSKMRPIEGSFQVLSSNKVGDVITGIITANPETVAYDEAVASNFKAVAGNMFMDDEENMWALRKTEAGDLLVKSRGADDADVISDLMTSLSSAGVGSMSFEAKAQVQRENGVRSELQGGDFITFVNPQTETVEFGAVVASAFDDNGRQLGTMAVQSSAGGETVILDRNMALAKFADVDYNDEGLVDEQTVEANAHSLEEISAYYQRVFQRDPSYFEKFMERWMNHVFA